jgi:hydroxymethylpyrimidine/phosphomethylpyrimidine kinase
MNHKKNVLTVAGSDSSGGAGIQADIKTFEALNVYGASVISAITSQNTLGVHDLFVLPDNVFGSQLEAVFSDIQFAAVKTGMLSSPQQILILTNILKERAQENIVVDPVMLSSSGYRLQEKAATDMMCKLLFPLSKLVTPNIPEAASLLEREVDWVKRHPVRACHDLIAAFDLNAVLLKGGHSGQTECTDNLVFKDKSANSHLKETSFTYQKQARRHTHGTGCTLASAIAAYLAQGADLTGAVDKAGQFLQTALNYSNTQDVGKGTGPLNHRAGSL